MLLHFNKYYGIYRNYEQTDVYPYPDEEDMEDVRLDEEIECHWRVVFEGK